MGISAGGSKGGAKSEMNVTPLVDVVLVLLVIFMVTMPIMMRNITIEVPDDLDDTTIFVGTTPILVKGLMDGTLELAQGDDKQVIQRTELATILHQRLKDQTSEKVVHVDFDDGVLWEDVVSIADTIKGVGKVSQATENGKTVSVREVIKIAIKKRTDKPATP